MFIKRHNQKSEEATCGIEENICKLYISYGLIFREFPLLKIIIIIVAPGTDLAISIKLEVNSVMINPRTNGSKTLMTALIIFRKRAKYRKNWYRLR